MATVLTAPHWKKIPYNDGNISPLVELEKASNAIKFAIPLLEQIHMS